jgi:DNA-binding transcriptional ArsR family regulator
MLAAMSRQPQHPEAHQINLSAVYDALSDPVRRQILARLAKEGELNCSAFKDYGSKTQLSYHFARMREAGLTMTRLEGTSRYMQLRIDDLQSRFPGLLEAVFASIMAEQAGESLNQARR